MSTRYVQPRPLLNAVRARRHLPSVAPVVTEDRNAVGGLALAHGNACSVCRSIRQLDHWYVLLDEEPEAS
jgi:hypothetical protein